MLKFMANQKSLLLINPAGTGRNIKNHIKGKLYIIRMAMLHDIFQAHFINIWVTSYLHFIKQLRISS